MNSQSYSPVANQSDLQCSQQLMSIPTKICDGLFMADHHIAKDVEWLQMNQVTHVINCAGKHCKNVKQVPGISFLSYDWKENQIQNIVDQNVIGSSLNFIEDAKKSSGSILVHCFESESRPFCILAAYLMIRYQWNLFKTLQFLNSRKEDIELEPDFFNQLTSLHQKLNERGLIKSRNWAVTDSMTTEEVIITNTFLNARRKGNSNQNSEPQASQSCSKRKKKNIIWKESIHTFHVYSPQTTLIELNPSKEVKQKEAESRNRSASLRQNKQNLSVSKQKPSSSSIQGREPFSSKQNELPNKSQTEEMSVTKKWAKLRESWGVQNKEANNYTQASIEGSTKEESILHQQPLSNSHARILDHSSKHELDKEVIQKKSMTSTVLEAKQQRISDRIQQKLNLIKGSGSESKVQPSHKQKPQYQNIQSNTKQRDHTPITGKHINKESVVKVNCTNKKQGDTRQINRSTKHQGMKKQRESLICRQMPQGSSVEESCAPPKKIAKGQTKEQINHRSECDDQQNRQNVSNKQNYILHNNWIINSQVKEKEKQQEFQAQKKPRVSGNGGFTINKPSENARSNSHKHISSSAANKSSSVIIVKPNSHFNPSQQTESRDSLRKYSESAGKRSQGRISNTHTNRVSLLGKGSEGMSSTAGKKNSSTAKFFTVDRNTSAGENYLEKQIMSKMRSNSTKPSRAGNSCTVENSNHCSSSSGFWRGASQSALSGSKGKWK